MGDPPHTAPACGYIQGRGSCLGWAACIFGGLPRKACRMGVIRLGPGLYTEGLASSGRGLSSPEPSGYLPGSGHPLSAGVSGLRIRGLRGPRPMSEGSGRGLLLLPPARSGLLPSAPHVTGGGGAGRESGEPAAPGRRPRRVRDYNSQDGQSPHPPSQGVVTGTCGTTTPSMTTLLLRPGPRAGAAVLGLHYPATIAQHYRRTREGRCVICS